MSTRKYASRYEILKNRKKKKKKKKKRKVEKLIEYKIGSLNKSVSSNKKNVNDNLGDRYERSLNNFSQLQTSFYIPVWLYILFLHSSREMLLAYILYTLYTQNPT
jgi:hypothetical protein